MNSTQNKGGNTPYSDGLDHVRNVYQQLEDDEPPGLLDQAILNSAHRAVEKKPHWMKFGWLHGLTTAAIFVLAFSIILNERQSATLDQEIMNGFEIQGDIANDLSVEKRSRAIQPSELRVELKKEARQQEALRTMQAQEIQPGAPLADDNDTMANEIMLEELALDEPALEADISGTARITQPPQAVAADAALQANEGQQAEQTAEQKLLAIIRLKQDGDNSWIKELELFKTTYPDYPLPSELED